MDDARRVRDIQRIGNLHSEVHQLLHRQGLALDAVLQRVAVEIFHDDVLTLVGLANVVDGAYIGMIERRRGPRLAPESLQRLRVPRQFIGQELQGHAPAQPQIFSFVNHTHAATAQFLRNAVVRDGLPDHKR